MKKHGSKISFRKVLITIVIILIILGISSHFSNKNKNVESENAGNANSENLDENNAENEEDIKEEEISKAKKKQKLPEWTDTAIQDIKHIYGSDEKQVYLTFDDGPSKEVTPKILEILEEEQVPATFFVLGKCVDMYPELVKEEYEAGHFIANHGYTHTYSKIYASVDSVLNEYNMANESIQNAIENPEYNCHLFRFPGGSSGGKYNDLKAKAKQVLADNNIASTNWNCLTSDAAGNNTVQSQYNGALETQGKQDSLIVLMHDAADKKHTPETLKLLIAHYKEEGYEFKNFYEIFTNEGKDKEQIEEIEEQQEIKEKKN